MIFMKVERNFLPWLATNKTLGNVLTWKYIEYLQELIYELTENQENLSVWTQFQF